MVHNISHSDLIVELSWIRDDDDDVTAKEEQPHSSSDGSSNAKERGHVVLENGTSVPLSLLGRPKFSLFQQISQTIMDKVEELRAAPVNSTHLSSTCEAVNTAGAASGANAESPTNNEISSSSTKHLHPSMLDIMPEQKRGRVRSGRWKAKCHDTQSPVGFKLDECPIPVASLHDFQIRGTMRFLVFDAALLFV